MFLKINGETYNIYDLKDTFDALNLPEITKLNVLSLAALFCGKAFQSWK